MKLGKLISLSTRNLMRQKRRSILLGIGIAFGMTVLVLLGSFTNGLSDMILNKMMVNMTGHISVSVTERNKKNITIVRDQERIISLITNNVENVDYIDGGVGSFTRIIGKGSAENSVMVGVEGDTSFLEEFVKSKEGDVYDFTNKSIPFPVLISDEKAKTLNIKLGDYVKGRFTSIDGQVVSAKFKVVAILKNDNPFFNMVMFTRLDDFKKILGYKESEIQSLQIVLKGLQNPSATLKQAQRLHAALKPGFAGIYGDVKFNGKVEKATVFGVMTNKASCEALSKDIGLNGEISSSFAKCEGSIISSGFAKKLGLKADDTVEISYTPKYEKEPYTFKIKIKAIFEDKKGLDGNVILANQKEFYDAYLRHLPMEIAKVEGAVQPDTNSIISSNLIMEWKLLERTITSAQNQHKMRRIKRLKLQGTVVDVKTMFEMAEQVIAMLSAFDMIGIVAVLILFFIVLIGVVNSLRMTIRERTREIATLRAIGMQRRDVLWLFILETVLLTFFAAIAGILFGLMIVGIAGAIPINAEGMMSFFLVNRKLYFLPSVAMLFNYTFIIMVMSLIASYFPSRKAANMSVSKAMGHFE